MKIRTMSICSKKLTRRSKRECRKREKGKRKKKAKGKQLMISNRSKVVEEKEGKIREIENKENLEIKRNIEVIIGTTRRKVRTRVRDNLEIEMTIGKIRTFRGTIEILGIRTLRENLNNNK